MLKQIYGTIEEVYEGKSLLTRKRYDNIGRLTKPLLRKEENGDIIIVKKEFIDEYYKTFDEKQVLIYIDETVRYDHSKELISFVRRQLIPLFIYGLDDSRIPREIIWVNSNKKYIYKIEECDNDEHNDSWNYVIYINFVKFARQKDYNKIRKNILDEVFKRFEEEDDYESLSEYYKPLWKATNDTVEADLNTDDDNFIETH